MKSKTQNKNAIIAILSVIIAIAAIFTFVPMQFGDSTYTGVWGSYGVSSEVYGGLYAEYDITGDASHDAIVDSMAKIKSNLQEQGYQSSNVMSIDDSKIRVEIGYPTTTEDGFKKAYTVLNNVAIGAFEFRSSQDATQESLVRVTGKDHIKEISVADFNSQTYLVIEFNEEGEAQFEALCKASTTVYVYMGEGENALQTSFEAKNITDFSQMQLTIADYKSAKDFYYKAMFGSISITLNPDTAAINTMTPLLGLGTSEGSSVLLYVLVGFIIALIIAAFIFFAVKYKMVAALLLPIIVLDAVIAGWILSAISMIEINVASLIAVAFGFMVIFGGSLSFMGRIAEEYKQGKSIDASIEAGSKKAIPAQAATSVILVLLFAVLALFIKGQVASASLIIIVFAVLNALTNILLLPWFVNLYNKSNKKQGTPFGLKQGENTNV